MIKAIPMEDWLRGCIYHDGRHGYVTLPIDKVHQIANYIQRTRRSTTDGLIDLKVVEADRNTEPQANADQHVQRVEYVENDEKSRCWTCKHFERMHETPIASDGNYYTYVVCTAKECHYEPKTEPQRNMAEDIVESFGFKTESYRQAKAKTEPQDCLTCRYNSDEWDSPKCDGCSKAHSNYEPQTDIGTSDTVYSDTAGYVPRVDMTDCSWK